MVAFVAKVFGRLDRQARQPEVRAHFGKRYLKLLQGTHDAIRFSQLLRKGFDRSGNLPGVEPVADAPMPGDAAPDVRRQSLQRILADDCEPGALELRSTRRRTAGSPP